LEFTNGRFGKFYQNCTKISLFGHTLCVERFLPAVKTRVKRTGCHRRMLTARQKHSTVDRPLQQYIFCFRNATLHLKLCGIVYIYMYVYGICGVVYVYQWLLKSTRFHKFAESFTTDIFHRSIYYKIVVMTVVYVVLCFLSE